MRSILLTPPARRVAAALMPGRFTILMLHRFGDDPAGAPYGRHTPAQLRALLEGLRKARTPIIGLAGLARELRAPTGSVVFTVDDGFADFAQVAWPVFRQFDCPVTVFLTTGFLDGRLWPWWERVIWGFEHTSQFRVRLDLGDHVFEGSWTGAPARRAVALRLIEDLKLVPDAAREAAIDALPGALSVAIPASAPPEHAPMSWDDVRRAGHEGATFGPHTVSHPILSRVDDRRAELEIVESWRRVREETDAVVPVFCYPNGDPGSFGPRERDIVARERFSLGLSTVPRQVRGSDLATAQPSRYALPRLACPHDARTLAWITSGWAGVRE